MRQLLPAARNPGQPLRLGGEKTALGLGSEWLGELPVCS